MRFEGVAEGRPAITMDSPPEPSPAAGPSPMQTVLLAMAGCTGLDVVSILDKMRVRLEGLTLEIEAERATEHPRVFTKIHVRYIVRGPNLQRDAVEKAVTLSLDKYCSVTAMLKGTAEVSYEIDVSLGQTAQ